MTSIHKQNCCV